MMNESVEHAECFHGWLRVSLFVLTNARRTLSENFPKIPNPDKDTILTLDKHYVTHSWRDYSIIVHLNPAPHPNPHYYIVMYIELRTREFE